MFANFENAFFKKKEAKMKIPKEVIASLSEKLPNGFVYADFGNGAVGITPESGKVTFSGLQPIFPEDFPSNFKPKSLKELTEYMYRTQTSIKLKANDNKFTINGQNFDVDEVIKFPFENSKASEFELYMYPSPFQPAFEITLKGIGVTKNLFIERQPYDNMNMSFFKSTGNRSFEISYLLDETDGTIKFNFNLNIAVAKSVNEALDALRLYVSCIKGSLLINGNILLPKPSSPDFEEESIDETILFWEKVKTLQEILNVVFIPQRQTEEEDVILIEQLYRSFYEKKPFKEYIPIKSFTVNGLESEKFEDILNKDGLSLQFTNPISADVFGVKLDLYSLVAYFDLKVVDIKPLADNNSKHQIIVQPIEGKKIYQSVLYFLNAIDANTYRQQTNISDLQNAEIIKI
ncbi:abortive infection system toxin AbiGii family protein [Fictibacillus sp. WQ 8-8]|uniref:abortive infection system toxin AbiGii family protein n=1 Tax=Fictibacillus sp. WQ 8-8 TaxID=2938788 RepID=UPI00210D6E19|nr:abortive infection system toxin AbiGii family protein [Fictibacillus sp. WQ 8-8]MCQ6267131.1 abortive infection system toxin AbiGii family protein [Fictibacillus sp. WQ 8-8]